MSFGMFLSPKATVVSLMATKPRLLAEALVDGPEGAAADLLALLVGEFRVRVRRERGGQGGRRLVARRGAPQTPVGRRLRRVRAQALVGVRPRRLRVGVGGEVGHASAGGSHAGAEQPERLRGSGSGQQRWAERRRRRAALSSPTRCVPGTTSCKPRAGVPATDVLLPAELAGHSAQNAAAPASRPRDTARVGLGRGGVAGWRRLRLLRRFQGQPTARGRPYVLDGGGCSRPTVSPATRASLASLPLGY